MCGKYYARGREDKDEVDEHLSNENEYKSTLRTTNGGRARGVGTLLVSRWGVCAEFCSARRSSKQSALSTHHPRQIITHHIRPLRQRIRGHWRTLRQPHALLYLAGRYRRRQQRRRDPHRQRHLHQRGNGRRFF